MLTSNCDCGHSLYGETSAICGRVERDRIHRQSSACFGARIFSSARTVGPILQKSSLVHNCMVQAMGNPAKKKRKRTTNQLLATAYHEAGHAAVAFYLEIPIAEDALSIVGGDDYDGMIYTNPSFLRRLGRLDSAELTDAKRLIAERYAIFALAGIEAQRRYRASSVRRYHSSKDYHDAIDVISYFAPDDEELEAYLRLLRIRARNIVALPGVWEWIEELAAALMEQRTLSRKDVLGIVQKVSFSESGLGLTRS
jgi:hypothetical protein